jgi:hypothetical protein
MTETIEKVTVYVSGREIAIPVGKHTVERLHELALVAEEHVLVIRNGDTELILDEVDVYEIIGGERFETRHRKECPVIAKINRTDVEFAHARVTGLHIKEHAIKKGLPIKLDFPLFHNETHGKKEPVADGQHVRLKRKHPSSFTCVAPDDNS